MVDGSGVGFGPLPLPSYSRRSAVARGEPGQGQVQLTRARLALGRRRSTPAERSSELAEQSSEPQCPRRVSETDERVPQAE